MATKTKATKTTKATKKMTAAQMKAWEERHREFLFDTVASAHRIWIKANRNSKLGDLLTYLNDVQDELLGFNEDDVLAQIIGELDVAADYLSVFTPVDEPVDGKEELATVGYRLVNVEEDIGYVEELIEEFSEAFTLKRLPKQKPWKVKG